jgi:hypothetical protein
LKVEHLTSRKTAKYESKISTFALCPFTPFRG